MKYLILSTLSDGNSVTQELYTQMCEAGKQTELIETESLKISHCIGCNDCWIKTPGLCCIKDDYEPILLKMLKADVVVFVSDINLGFVSSKTKNLFDRILPMATMQLKYVDGQMRHYSRYDISPDMMLLYTGNADNRYLNHWLHRAAKNLHSTSLGAFSITKKGGAISCTWL